MLKTRITVRKQLTQQSSGAGFSLVKLLAAVVVVAVIAALAVVVINYNQQRLRDTQRVSDIEQIRTALQWRYAELNDYPAEFMDDFHIRVCTGLSSTVCVLGREVRCLDNVGWKDDNCKAPVYLSLVPSDPSSETDMPCSADASAVCDYAYNRVAADNYQIYFYLEGRTNDLAGAQVHCATQNGIGNSLLAGRAVCP